MPRMVDEALVLKLHRRGLRQVDIAEAVGTKQPTVSAVIRRHNKRVLAALEGGTDARKVLVDSMLEIVHNAGRDQDRIKAAEQVAKMLGLNAPERQEIQQSNGPQKIQLEYVNAPNSPGPEIRYTPFQPEDA